MIMNDCARIHCFNIYAGGMIKLQLPGKNNPRFIVTDIPAEEGDAKSLYEDVYGARGDMENRIKEQQLCLFADRSSTWWMSSNQLRLYFSTIAYVFFVHL